jgi:hypothetical protein
VGKPRNISKYHIVSKWSSEKRDSSGKSCAYIYVVDSLRPSAAAAAPRHRESATSRVVCEVRPGHWQQLDATVLRCEEANVGGYVAISSDVQLHANDLSTAVFKIEFTRTNVGQVTEGSKDQ